MNLLFTNKIFQALLVFVLVIGGYALYLNVNYVETGTGEVVPVEEAMVEIENMPEEVVLPDPNEPLDLSGIHIMGDGLVMTGSGVTVPDATVTSDGTIILPDGTEMEPEFDMRPKEEAEPEILTETEEMPTEVIEAGPDEEIDLAGIHIMPDGSVMTGAGITLSDASVNDEGIIILSDGTELEPAFDLRPENDE